MGEAFINHALQDANTQIISVSRSLSTAHEGIAPEKLLFIQADLSQSFDPGIMKRMTDFIAPDSHIFFLNNAGVISPIGPTGNFEQETIATAVQVNIQYPVSLVNALLSQFRNQPLTLVNITSGAGNRPIAHWAMYCSSKAFMKMFFSVMAEENKTNEQLHFYDIDPGVMDTGMQQNIRESDFPGQDYFQSLKSEGNLLKPADAARNILDQINYGA